jgi:TolA-binding protein
MKKYIIVCLTFIFISLCGKKQDPVEKLFSRAEALDSKIIESVNTISLCQSTYEKILAEAPDSKFAPLACYRLGKLNELFGHYPEAVEFYKKFVTVFPQHALHAEALFNIAQIYFNPLEQLDKAMDTYRQVIFFHPECEFKFTCLLRLGEISSRNESWQESVKYFQQAADEFPKNEMAADLLFRIGDILQNKINDGAGAEKIYTRLLDNYPGSSWCQFAKTRIAELNKGDQS